MVRGINDSKLIEIKERLAELKKKKLVPESYTIHNSVQVLPERVVDTTDRSMINIAKQYGFDSAGFAEGDPLRKSTFYTNPFMTCSWCNLITYIDVITVRWMVAAGIFIRFRIYV